MKIGWYQALNTQEKQWLCYLLKRYDIAKNLHPGSLIFVDQKKLASWVRDYKSNVPLADKLNSTCSGCGVNLNGTWCLGSAGEWSSWVCEACDKAHEKQRSLELQG